MEFVINIEYKAEEFSLQSNLYCIYRETVLCTNFCVQFIAIIHIKTHFVRQPKMPNFAGPLPKV